MCNFSASPSSWQYGVTDYWSESLVRDVLSMAYLIYAMYTLLSFSCFSPPWCIFFFFLMKHPWVNTVQHPHQTVIVIYEAWSGKYRPWVLSSRAHTLSRMCRDRTWTCLLCSHRRYSKGSFQRCFVTSENMTWFKRTDLVTLVKHGNLSSQLKWAECVLVSPILFWFSC